MIDLYKYGEILGLINISTVLSIAIISILLYTVSKDTSLLITSWIYFIELVLYYFLDIYNYKNNIDIHILSIISIFNVIKLVSIIILIRKLGLRKDIDIVVLILNVVNLITINYSYKFTILMIILTNFTILKQIILDKVKQYNLLLRLNKQELQVNKRYIEEWDNKAFYEYELQNKYKDEISSISYKISKAIEESDIPIFLLNINKEYIYSNQSFKKFIKEDKVQEENLDILVYLQQKFIDNEKIIKTIKEISNKKCENITVKSSNSEVYRFICTTDTINEQNVIICILNNITQSTVIQNKLKESEERYKNLMDILNEGIIIHDESNVSYINSKALELFELKQLDENIKVEDIKMSINKKYRYKFLIDLDSIKIGNEERIVSKLETKNGKLIEFITTKLSFNEKEVFISIIVDITELENALSDIEQSEKTYKLLLHTLPEGIMIIESKNKKHSYINESMMGILKTIGIENLNSLIKKYIDESEYGKFKKISIDFREKVEIAIAIIERKEDGNLVVIVRMLDYEYKMKKIKQELKNISQKSKFKTEFLYKIINDIKEPINEIHAINNNINKNKYKYKSGYIENYTRLLKQNCYRLIRLSNNIEEVNKIENGESNLELRKCDIVKLTKNIVHISQFYAKEKEITMKFSSTINKKIIGVDVNKIEKIILNILSNAIKFTNPGGRIDISIKVDGEIISISIKDTGIGISKDDIDTIFESFEQVDRTLSRGAEGTGIGLYLVKKLSEIHNININVESELDKGSEFKVLINERAKFTDVQVDNRIYSDLNDTEKIDIEFSDIYFDIS